ncbi:MAG: hypothetical protein IPM59_08105 [Chloracidobacterium sp.]|nr:hypothetical protein [Chloracidobacterium sp.]
MKADHLRQYILFAILLSALGTIPAAGHEDHNKKSPSVVTSVAGNANSVVETPAAATPISRSSHSEFPTLHPLIVHFPIMLIILAAVLQLISLGVFRSEMAWLVICFAFAGAVTAWLSSNTFHPHTAGLNENAQRLLLEHEQFASLTFWFTVAGLAVKTLSNFVLKRSWWSEAVATLLLAAAAAAVAMAGHHGAELVHKEGVGPRGEFLETHDHR